MSFNLSAFRKNVHSIARNQYFQVRIPQVGNSEVITALARETSLPAMTQGTLSVAYRGLNMKIVDKPDFPDWSVTFLCDEAHALRNILLKWMEKAYSVQSLRNEAHNEYKRDGLSVSQLSAKLENTATCTFYGAFPSSVGEVALSQEGGSVETFVVTFANDYYVMNSLSGDVVFNDIDIDVSAEGIMTGVTVAGVGGVRLNF